MTNKTLSPTARLIARRIEDLAPEVTQSELARKMGFNKPNMLSMIKTGRADVPFAKIPEIAKALDLDPALLLRTFLKDQWPQFGRVVDQIIGGIVTPAEREWHKLFSEIHLDAPPTDPIDRKICKEILREFARKRNISS